MSCLPVEQIFSTGNLAERLGVSRNQIAYAIKEKRVITPTKINGRWTLTDEHARVLADHFNLCMINKALSSVPKAELFKNHFAAGGLQERSGNAR